jgi:MFS family permease
MSLNNRMSSSELRATGALASIMSLRMLGLFMIYPVFSIYAQDLPDVTPTLIGVAIGIYGLTQATFQIPFGMLSDRFGRKPIIYMGLIIFAFGSVVAAMSTTIVGIIIGRVLQGGGAIASTVLALGADLTRDEHRTKAMAIIGVTIGMSFILALLAGPFLNSWIGVSGIFWLTAVLALAGIAVLRFWVPEPENRPFVRENEPLLTRFKKVLQDTQLLRLDIGVLLLHGFLTSLFVVLPIALVNADMEAAYHGFVYVPILIISIMTMVPFMLIAEKYQLVKLVFVGAIGVLGLSELGLSFFYQSFTGIVVMLFFFFAAVNLLEANLPSLMSKIAPPESKGTAMGVYSSSQFFGAFLGGLVGGWVQQHYDIGAVFALSAVLTFFWFLLAATMQSPPRVNQSKKPVLVSTE